jgi:hypothetical protein
MGQIVERETAGGKFSGGARGARGGSSVRGEVLLEQRAYACSVADGRYVIPRYFEGSRTWLSAEIRRSTSG